MKIDYSKTVFAKGIVCYHVNSRKKCIVIDRARGIEDDECSVVIEFICGKIGIEAEPNSLLIPTGEYVDIAAIENLLNSKPVMFGEERK